MSTLNVLVLMFKSRVSSAISNVSGLTVKPWTYVSHPLIGCIHHVLNHLKSIFYLKSAWKAIYLHYACCVDYLHLGVIVVPLIFIVVTSFFWSTFFSEVWRWYFLYYHYHHHLHHHCDKYHLRHDNRHDDYDHYHGPPPLGSGFSLKELSAINEGFFPFVRRPVWTIDLSQTLWEVLDIKSGLEGGEDVLSSSGNSCPTTYCGTRSLINDILRSGGGEGRTRRKQNCDFTRWLSLSINSRSSFHLGLCHLFYIQLVLSLPFS